MLEVDDEGGRMFLRVLIHLTMHDYAPLVSGALQLLFKHFSQRQEAMHTFKQVLPTLSSGPWGGEGRPVHHLALALARQAALATHWLALGTGGEQQWMSSQLRGLLEVHVCSLRLAELLIGEGQVLATFIFSWFGSKPVVSQVLIWTAFYSLQTVPRAPLLASNHAWHTVCSN